MMTSTRGKNSPVTSRRCRPITLIVAICSSVSIPRRFPSHRTRGRSLSPLMSARVKSSLSALWTCPVTWFCPEDLQRFLLVSEGQTFSQQIVTSTEEFMTRRLGNEGYNFAKVTGIPEVDEENNSVAMKFFVDPGKRTYVRRIDFKGNLKTVDDVLRREMRQMESAPASAAAIEQSRVRLERLGFFSRASVETPEVPGHDDLIDVEYTVEEQSSGSIGASFGFAQDAGLILGLNLQQDNFLGTGKRVGIALNSSKFQDLYNFSYTNPYFTEDGVSRGFNLFYRSTDLDEVNVASYSTDTLGGAINFGYHIKETERLGISFGVSNTRINTGRFAVQEIQASPRLNKGVDDYFLSTLQDDGTYADVKSCCTWARSRRTSCLPP